MSDIHSVVSVDVVALSYDSSTGQVRVAIPRRDREPFTGTPALPGVVVHSGERLADAAHRALSKFTATAPGVLGQLMTFDEPARDPRGPSLSIAMYAVFGDVFDEGSAPIRDLPSLAFDHNAIVEQTLPLLAARLWADVAFTRALLPAEFTTRDARAVTAALTGTDPHMGNLNRVIDASGARKVGSAPIGPGRPVTVRTFPS